MSGRRNMDRLTVRDMSKKMSTYANTGCQSDDLRSGTDSLEEWRV